MPTASRYEASITREGENEPSAAPSIVVIRPDTLPLEPEASLLAHGFAVAEKAIRSLDHTIPYTDISAIGTPEPVEIDESFDDYHPDYEESGWRAFIEWNE